MDRNHTMQKLPPRPGLFRPLNPAPASEDEVKTGGGQNGTQARGSMSSTPTGAPTAGQRTLQSLPPHPLLAARNNGSGTPGGAQTPTPQNGHTLLDTATQQQRRKEKEQEEKRKQEDQWRQQQQREQEKQQHLLEEQQRYQLEQLRLQREREVYERQQKEREEQAFEQIQYETEQREREERLSHERHQEQQRLQELQEQQVCAFVMCMCHSPSCVCFSMSLGFYFFVPVCFPLCVCISV